MSQAPAVGARAGEGSRVAAVLAAGAVAYGTVAAARSAWLCDDAFISFRYADHLANGLGLVYNAGERVEGYSNFLWTIWVAVGMHLGVRPETWSVAWGVLFYAATIGLLYINHRWIAEQATPSRAVPLACLLAAVHRDWNIYATGGLETSMFTFLAVLGYLLAVNERLGVRGAAGAGFALALAAMTRPDGPLFVPIVGLYLLWTRRPVIPSALAFAGAFSIAWLPYLAWKLFYYGDFFTNTYYAKSAGLAWYDQGWFYVRLYFQRYWVLAAALPLALLAFAGRRAGEGVAERCSSPARRATLAAALALAYTLYVAHVGGDFMYARLLIPVTPFYLVVLELAVSRLASGRAVVQWAGAAAAVAGVAFTPSPLAGTEPRRGIVDEWRIYSPEVIARTHAEGLTLRRYFDGLPVRIAYVGSQASLAYYARPAVAIESQTGLTDRWIAHQPIARRGRIGHEKAAPLDYLIDRRRVHFTIHHFAGAALDLDSAIPMVPIVFDTVPGRIVCWDPAVLDELRRRGARFVDFPAWLDQYAPTLDSLRDDQAAQAYQRIRRLYFEHVRDPRREALFLARLSRGRESGR